MLLHMFPFPPLSFFVGAGAIRWRFKSPTLFSRQPVPLVYWHESRDSRRGSLSRLTQGSPRRPAGAVLRNWQLADAARLSDHQMRDGWVDGELEMR